MRTRTERHSAFHPLIIMAAGLLLLQPVYAGGPTHLDRSKNERSCSACHSGHGRRGSGTLRESVPKLCYSCHSPFAERMTSASRDVYTDFRKRYGHPVDQTAKDHNAAEILPEEDVTRPRHVSCLDCHSPHQSEQEAPTKDVRGYSARGRAPRKAESISEVCYKCHADSVNRPVDSPNTKDEFAATNASYHPVEERVRGGGSISIESGLSGKTIECVDCHDPHGSENEFMLRMNYNTGMGPELQFAYELCYSCHRRNSIVSDQSFEGHKKHVTYEHIPCSSCHSAHGSRDNKALIRFDEKVVSPNPAGMINYVKTGGRNSCYLTCHGVEHEGPTVTPRGRIKKK